MAKLRDMVVNIVPKLDVRKAESMLKKFAQMGQKAFGGILKGLSKAGKGLLAGGKALGKAGTYINQGSDLLEKLTKVLNKPRNLVNEAMSAGDLIADTAESLSSTPARILQVLTTLSKGGAGEKATLDLMRKFAAKAPDNGITGNLDDAFVAVLREIGQKDGSQRQELINKYFGARAGVQAKDAIAAAKDWFKLRTSVEYNQRYGDAITNAEAAAGRADDIAFRGNLDRILLSSEKGLFEAELRARMEEEAAKTKTLSSTSAKTLANVATSVTKLESTIEIAIQKGVDIGTKIVDAMGIFDVLNQSIAMLSDVIQKFSLQNIGNATKDLVNKTVEGAKKLGNDLVNFVTGKKGEEKSQ